MFYKDDYVGKPSWMKCPINGSDLIYDGYEYGTMDGDSYYHSEADPSLKYEKNMRSVFFELVHKESRWMSRKEERVKRRYFKQVDNGGWEEWFAVEGTYKLFQIGTPQEAVEAHIKREQEEKDERKREYDRGVASGEIDPFSLPIVVRVMPTSIASDLMSVKPMAAPTGATYYCDVQYDPIAKITYPYLVTADTIEQIKKDFRKEDIMIGDEITSWDQGGWEALAGRAGEHVRRNGEILHTRLTRMS